MTSVQLDTARDDRSARRRHLRAVLLPVEHGGWGLTLEPVLVGLIVSASVPGLAIGLAIVTAFLARQPLRIVTGPSGNSERVRLASTVLGVEVALMIAFALIAVWYEAIAAIIFLLLSSPLALFLLWRDRQRRSRDLIAELSAALFMACGAVAIVLAGGGSKGLTITLGLLISARSVGAILHVRERVSRRKGRPVSRAVPIGFHVAVFAATAGLAYASLANILAPLAFALLLGRTLFPVGHETPAKLGWSEMRAGLVSVLLIGFSLI